MDNSSISWLTELEMEDSFLFDQCEMMDPFGDELAAALGEEFQNSLSSESNSSSSTLIPRSNSTTTLCASSSMEPPPNLVSIERPSKLQKPNNYTSSAYTIPNHDQPPCSTPFILSFGNSNVLTDNNNNNQHIPVGTITNEDEVVSDVLMCQGGFLNVDDQGNNKSNGQVIKKSNGRTRPPSQTYDHIIAERKRREQLSQRFVALSAIVPGLKKMDKTSVLGDAIKYLKQLQERVKTLEEQSTKQTMESVIFVKKSQLLVDEDEGSSDENFVGGSSDEPLPEIEARVSEKNVLLRIHCEKNKGVVVKILTEIEKLNLVVVNTSVSPFASLALDITIIAEMEKEYSMTVKDLVKSLRKALKRII